MVIARLWGGLGNQLFQYTAGFSVAANLKSDLRLDPTQCDADRNRPYELNHFKISGRIWTDDERRWAERLIRITRPVDARTGAGAKLLKRMIRPILDDRFTYLEDRHDGFQPGCFDARGHVYMAGTWASEKYFDRIRSTILNEFSFAAEPDEENARVIESIESCPAICVHVRRGDYVTVTDTAERFGLCSLDYYQQAIKYLLERMIGLKAFIFSDDPIWTKQNLHLPCESIYVTHNTGHRNHEDLRLMAACKHFIIANSTFSWWGAWLARNPEKIVVAPKRWSIDPRGIGDPVPERWIRL